MYKISFYKHNSHVNISQPASYVGWMQYKFKNTHQLVSYGRLAAINTGGCVHTVHVCGKIVSKSFELYLAITMARTTQKARKSTGDSVPHRSGIQLELPASENASNNMSVVKTDHRQVSMTDEHRSCGSDHSPSSIYCYYCWSINHLIFDCHRTSVTSVSTAMSFGCAICVIGWCAQTTLPCQRTPTRRHLFLYVLHVTSVLFLNRALILWVLIVISFPFFIFILFCLFLFLFDDF